MVAISKREDAARFAFVPAAFELLASFLEADIGLDGIDWLDEHEPDWDMDRVAKVVQKVEDISIDLAAHYRLNR